MGKFKVTPEKELSLLSRMDRLQIKESDLIETFVRGSGPGGQKINKTSSAVQLLHKPSGIEIKCQHSRSQALNRFTARRMLCDRLEAEVLGRASREQQERERIRRQKRKRSKRAKERMLEQKKIRSQTKSSRARPKGFGE